MQAIDVLCVGATSVDMVFRTPCHPAPDEKISASEMVLCGGGPAANAAVMVSKMGLKSAFAGYLGSDLYGRIHMEELSAAGVDTALVVRGDHPTPVSAVIVKPSGERSVINYRAAGAVLDRDRIAMTDMHPRVILFDGHEPELSSALLDHARLKGITTVLDAGSLNRGTLELYHKVDHLVCSERFAHEITGAPSPEAAMADLFAPARSVVITLGGSGLLWKHAGGDGRLPAFSVDVKDTTGAGDVFHGAFAGSLAIGRPWDELLAYASAAAALSCTRLGARAGIPEGAEVEAFLRRTSCLTMHPPNARHKG
ncbi:MAG: PfkB family carbohydrate kinase [Thermodesulfobacteriota bacterium]